MESTTFNMKSMLLILCFIQIWYLSFVSSLDTNCDCGQEFSSLSSSNRIVHGNDTAEGKYPWMVYIKVKGQNVNPRRSNCGGSLISNQDILTAAHCLKGVTSNDDISVYIGLHEAPNSLTSFMKSKTPSLKVASFILHPQYQVGNQRRMFNDIAIIKLQTPVDVDNETLQRKPFAPVCLSFNDEDIESLKDSLFVTGYGVQGKNLLGRLIDSPVLKEAKTELIDLNTCRNQYPGQEISPMKQFCAGTPSSGWTCNGDSGGVIAVKNRETGKIIQVGIVSLGPENCNIYGFTKSNIFVKTSGHRDFIEKHTKGSRLNCPLNEMNQPPMITIKRKANLKPNKVLAGANIDPVPDDKLLDCVCGDKSNGLTQNRHPWNIIVEAREFNNFNKETACDGVVISDRHVVAPAECVQGKLLFVRRGFKGDAPKFSVKNVNSLNHVRRFALIELDQPMTFDKEVAPICLAGFDTATGDTLNIEGSLFPIVYPQRFPQDQKTRERDCSTEAETVCTNCFDYRDFVTKDKEGLEYLIGVADYYASRPSCSNSQETKLAEISSFYSFFKESTRDAKWCPSKHHLIANTTEIQISSDCQCGVPGATPRIAWLGKAAGKGKYPWIVSVVDKNINPSKPCAGTLISDRHILTSARCVIKITDKTLNMLDVKLNAYTDDDRQTLPTVAISKVFVHPDYNSKTYFRDIAIIKLTNPLPRNEKLVPICLPEKQASSSKLYFSGWGVSADSRSNGKYGSKNLNEIVASKYADSYCKGIFGNLFHNDADMCAGQCLTSSGDGGGPLSEINSKGRYVQVGLSQVSYTGCPRGTRGPDSFQSVFKNLKWIQDTISDGLMCKGPNA